MQAEQISLGFWIHEFQKEILQFASAWTQTLLQDVSRSGARFCKHTASRQQNAKADMAWSISLQRSLSGGEKHSLVMIWCARNNDSDRNKMLSQSLSSKAIWEASLKETFCLRCVLKSHVHDHWESSRMEQWAFQVSPGLKWGGARQCLKGRPMLKKTGWEERQDTFWGYSRDKWKGDKMKRKSGVMPWLVWLSG